MLNLDKLNKQQREAVELVEGPVLIVAGAGSGKTLVLTYRIANLISKGVHPSEILALTFTNKAANEMKERVKNLVGTKSLNIVIGTFHSIFARILRSESKYLDFTNNFTIYDEDDSLSLLKNVINDLNFSSNLLNPRIVRSKISNAKNKLIFPEDYDKFFFGFPEDKISLVYNEYQKRLRLNNAMDFDDLLLMPIKLFESNLDLLNAYRKRFRYILVDEYQDTNTAQYKVLKLLTNEKENICVVGDDAQSIYKWRGADINYILSFNSDFPNARTIRLEQNYRSTQNILNAADSVIKRNYYQIKKTLWTENELGEKVSVLECLDEKDEANSICKLITEKMLHLKSQAKNFAVLYRTNAQSRNLEEAFLKSTIPYTIVGGIEFYKRKEVKDVLAYLRLLINKKDSESFLRVINYPSRGIGEISLTALKNFANEKEISLYEAIDSVYEINNLNERAKKSFISFKELIEKYTSLLEKLSLNEVARSLMDELGILRMYKEENTEESLGRYENIIELLNAIQEFSENNPKGALSDFLQEISLTSDVDKWEDKSNCVTLMTLHSAKGLEFENVFIVGCEDGLFPLSYDSNREDLEEERRLFYVGCTRAKKNLTITFARNRNRFGNSTPQKRSRFIDEIGEEYIEFKTTFNSTVKVKISHRTSRIENRHLQKMPSYEDYSQEEKVLTIGSKVAHDVFGVGKVVQLSGYGDNLKAIVDFDEGFSKHLMLKYAKLKIL